MMLTKVQVGIDEVGRGVLAGPLVVGACALLVDPDHFLRALLTDLRLKKLRDSKKHPPKQREVIFTYLEQKPGIIWAVGEVEAAEVDYFGLSSALKLAAERALAGLKKQGYLPAKILADAGLYHPFEASIPTERIIRGDEQILEITLASIMAKVWRDRQMSGLAEHYPDYGFAEHVGYGTRRHYEALRSKGITKEHRQSFLKNL